MRHCFFSLQLRALLVYLGFDFGPDRWGVLSQRLGGLVSSLFIADVIPEAGVLVSVAGQEPSRRSHITDLRNNTGSNETLLPLESSREVHSLSLLNKVSELLVALVRVDAAPAP